MLVLLSFCVIQTDTFLKPDSLTKPESCFTRNLTFKCGILSSSYKNWLASFACYTMVPDKTAEPALSNKKKGREKYRRPFFLQIFFVSVSFSFAFQEAGNRRAMLYSTRNIFDCTCKFLCKFLFL